MNKVKSHLRGGARAGAGRKPKKDKRVQLSTTIAPETMAFLQSLKKGDLSLGQILDGILGHYYNEGLLEVLKK